MPRKRRVEEIGFYYIINHGVDKSNIYLSDEDYQKFMEIAKEAADDFSFEIFSFCLMANHYHLLIKTYRENLSSAMQKINSRYSIYFNNKYKRVGPLWQGRFKSWYVYDEIYLKALVKYIEFNPIKANMTQKIGEYRWAMSSANVECLIFNFELIDDIDFNVNITEKEQKEIDTVFSAKFELTNDVVTPKEIKSLDSYFTSQEREIAIMHSSKDGYTQKEIADYLGLSNVAISKIIKIYKQKNKLFNKLRDKGIFWSYKKDLSLEEAGESLSIEYLLKYGDFDDIKLGLELFGKRVVKKVWEEKLKSDKQFIKTNLLIARVFFNMDVESDYFKKVKNERLEKLRLLAS